MWHASAAAFDYRLTGLAAEAAFFAILSLPPLIFGLIGSIGFISNSFNTEVVHSIRSQVLELAGQIFTVDTVSEIIRPTVDEVLQGGRFDIISIGFLLALWSGSRVVNVFVDTVTIMYGMGGERGFVKQRFLSFGAYLIVVLLGVVVIPLVLIGPALIYSAIPAPFGWLAQLYWPIVIVLSVFALTSIYQLILPVRRRWTEGLPGAVVSVAVWVGGSALLRWFLSYSVGGSTSIYGPLATPIAILLWLYVISVAILVGAALNSGLRESLLENDLRSSK